MAHPILATTRVWGALPSDTFSFGELISADGQVIAGTSYGNAGSEGFVWTAGSGMSGLGTIPATRRGTRVFGMSADGTVVVGVTDAPGGAQAFRWKQSARPPATGRAAGRRRLQ